MSGNHEARRASCRRDTDESGSINMDELCDALKELRSAFQAKHGRAGWKFSIEEKIAVLNARAAAGRMAIAAAERAERVAGDLETHIQGLDGSVEVQLGLLLAKRRVNVGEVVGTWAKTRGNNAKRELSKQEFKDEVERLGLRINGSAVTRKQLSSLFDSVDSDQSGYLDLEEAKMALKKWQALACDAQVEREKLDRKVRRFRTLAAKKLQAALRPPDTPGSPLHVAASELDDGGVSTPMSGSSLPSRRSPLSPPTTLGSRDIIDTSLSRSPSVSPPDAVHRQSSIARSLW